uniref:Uncharacterized protein n=1 Tax=Rangifer tarandus platyrhynchus TaxID=3082113 RepID=A0ACB0E5Y5_RANTA|nr:unnamed protein product [Rangifer tarandus platyrhynchus]
MLPVRAERRGFLAHRLGQAARLHVLVLGASSRRTLFSPTATPWAWARCAASIDTSASARASTATPTTTRATASARASPLN